MNDLFAPIYETFFNQYNVKYNLVFQVLYDGRGYIKFGLIFILIPLILWGVFYYLWKYPYAKIWHWLLWLFVVTLVVFGTTWGIANSAIFASNNQELNDALADPNSGYSQYASTLPMHYALINGLISLLIGFIYSLIMKQFSKVQIHLPF
jgi:hypothetical protein